VPKNAPFPALLAAVRDALAGREVMPQERREQFIELHRRRSGEENELCGKLERLTPREREVLAREPKRLRLRLFSIAGRLARTGPLTILHLAAHAPGRRSWPRPSPACEHALRLGLTPSPSGPTTPDTPACGTGAHPSDLGRTVIPTMQNHTAKTGHHRPRSRRTSDERSGLTSTYPRSGRARRCCPPRPHRRPVALGSHGL
jgi:hypothetical protein